MGFCATIFRPSWICADSEVLAILAWLLSLDLRPVGARPLTDPFMSACDLLSPTLYELAPEAEVCLALDGYLKRLLFYWFSGPFEPCLICNWVISYWHLKSLAFSVQGYIWRMDKEARIRKDGQTYIFLGNGEFLPFLANDFGDFWERVLCNDILMLVALISCVRESIYRWFEKLNSSLIKIWWIIIK